MADIRPQNRLKPEAQRCCIPSANGVESIWIGFGNRFLLSHQERPDMNKKSAERAWAVNERLLQSYRSIFIASQSFLLAVGALLIDGEKPNWLFGFVATASLIMIWYIWFPVVVARAKIVDYYKLQVFTDIADEPGFCSEEEYLRCAPRRKAMNAVGGKKNWRVTRIKVDLFLPIIFTVIWAVLFWSKYIG